MVLSPGGVNILELSEIIFIQLFFLLFILVDKKRMWKAKSLIQVISKSPDADIFKYFKEFEIGDRVFSLYEMCTFLLRRMNCTLY